MINDNESEDENYRSHRYNISRFKTRRRHKCSKYKNCISVMVLICIEQHLSNI